MHNEKDLQEPVSSIASHATKRGERSCDGAFLLRMPIDFLREQKVRQLPHSKKCAIAHLRENFQNLWSGISRFFSKDWSSQHHANNDSLIRRAYYFDTITIVRVCSRGQGVVGGSKENLYYKKTKLDENNIWWGHLNLHIICTAAAYGVGGNSQTHQWIIATAGCH